MTRNMRHRKKENYNDHDVILGNTVLLEHCTILII